MSIYDLADEVLSSIADTIMGECFIIIPMVPGRLASTDKVDTSRIQITVNGIFHRSILTSDGGRQSLSTSRTTEVNSSIGPDWNQKYIGMTLFASVDAREFQVDGDLALLPKKPDRLQRVEHPEDQLYAINLVEDDGGGRYVLHLVEASE